MKDLRRQNRQAALFIAVILPIAWAGAARAELSAKYLFHLSNFSGTVPYSVPRLFVDEVRQEVYVAAGESVGIFNGQGMEIFRFSASDLVKRSIYDIALQGDGAIYLLTYAFTEDGNLGYHVERCNYRGEVIDVVEVRGLSERDTAFRPTRMLLFQDLIYLADLATMQVVTATLAGEVHDRLDLAELIGMGDDRQDAGMMDMSIDRDGAILFTSPVRGRAYRVTPDRKVEVFGKRGSTPGRFGIPTSMVRDEAGYYYVADSLRCVVMVFDERFGFQFEFGGRGYRPGSIIGPRSLALDRAGRLYVSQIGKRGVSVFQISRN